MRSLHDESDEGKLVDFGKLNVNAFKAFQYNLLGM